eukprot:1679139-Alexandrium_andersonii.AAC.1
MPLSTRKSAKSDPPPPPQETPQEPPRGPQNSTSRRQIRNLREKQRRTDPSGASGTDFEAVPGSAQFQVRTREAILHFPALEQ